MSGSHKPIIAIIGAGKCSGKVHASAVSAGRKVAELGGVLVCGGLGGVMEAAAMGAKQAGGTTIGILPSADKQDANPYIDYVIPSGLGEARNLLVVRTADAVVALPGKFGTLSEMAFALLHHKPVISVKAWDLGDDVIHVDDAEEAVVLAMRLAKGDSATAKKR